MRRLAAAIAILAFCAPCAALDDRDLYDPAALAARVRELADAGDFTDARIMLARAARIAPDDARVAHARDVLEARAAGREPPPGNLSAGAQSASPQPKRAAPVVAPAPPAPWNRP